MSSETISLFINRGSILAHMSLLGYAGVFHIVFHIYFDHLEYILGSTNNSEYDIPLNAMYSLFA